MQVPASMKNVWENIKSNAQATGSNQITKEQFAQLGDAANSDGIIDKEEQNFLDAVQNSEFMSSTNSIEGKASTPVSFVDENVGVVPESMVETWKSVSTDGVIDENDLSKLKNAAAPTGKNEEFDNEELMFLSNLVDKANDHGQVILNPNKNTSSSNTKFGEVPASLKQVWDKVSADGSISADDLDALIMAAAPKEKQEEIDNEEMSFLVNIRDSLGSNNGNPISISSSDKSAPVLLNWPGYNSQTKQALRDAYGDLSTGSKMPILRNDAASEVAKGFGASNIRELQSIVGAKADGKFGPETYFKAKAFVANLINTNPKDPRISEMLSVLGNDSEAQRMRDTFNSNNSETPVNPPANNDTPAKPPVNLGDVDPSNPESIKSFKNKVNLLSDLYAKGGVDLGKVNNDSELTDEFAGKLRDMEQTIGKPVAQAIYEIEAELKSKGFSKLDNRSADFVKLTPNGIQITGEPKDMTRVNAAKELLSKLGFDISNYEISKVENPEKNGDLILKSGNTELAIFDNVSNSNRGADNFGDLHIVGKYDNKKIDVSYWENDRRGEKSIKSFNRFHLKTVIDGKEMTPIKQNESILIKPLIQVK